MKKKLLAIFTASLTLLTLFGCNKTKTPDAISSEVASAETSEVVSEETKEVTSLSQVQPMEGFTDRMDDILVRYDWQIGNTVLTTDNTVEDLIQTIQDFYGYADEDIFYGHARGINQIDLINYQLYGPSEASAYDVIGDGGDVPDEVTQYKNYKDGNECSYGEKWATDVEKALNSKMWVADDIFANTANTDFDSNYLFDTNCIEIREIPLLDSPNSGIIYGRNSKKSVDRLDFYNNFARMRIYPEKVKGLPDGSNSEYLVDYAAPIDVVYSLGTHKIFFIGYCQSLDLLNWQYNYYDYDASLNSTSVYYRKAGEYAGEIETIDVDLNNNPIEPYRKLILQ